MQYQTENSAFWIADRPEGTVMFRQTCHFDTLVRFGMEYILKRDEGLQYIDSIRKLSESLRGEDWIFQDLKSFPPPLASSMDEFSSESNDSRIRVKWREGEHSVFITIDMAAK